jgi:hypothetical protein
MLETDILVHEGRITEDAILEGPVPTMTLLAVHVLFFPFLFMSLSNMSYAKPVLEYKQTSKLLPGKENRYSPDLNTTQVHSKQSFIRQQKLKNLSQG